MTKYNDEEMAKYAKTFNQLCEKKSVGRNHQFDRTFYRNLLVYANNHKILMVQTKTKLHTGMMNEILKFFQKYLKIF